jgi:hypothetical protein
MYLYVLYERVVVYMLDHSISVCMLAKLNLAKPNDNA